MPGSVLLSHGEAPYYHRRKTFSLLSSEWNQVVPVRYGHQAKRYRNERHTAIDHHAYGYSTVHVWVVIGVVLLFSVA